MTGRKKKRQKKKGIKAKGGKKKEKIGWLSRLEHRGKRKKLSKDPYAGGLLIKILEQGGQRASAFLEERRA